MPEIQQIRIDEIDPESPVNVRRSGIQENVERLKSSIETNGYWPDKPITIRKHPDENSGFIYQYIEGQCRLKAASALELESIPAVILEISDDEAIQRSWTENEQRGELSPSDKAYWVVWAIRKYDGQGYTFNGAREKAAEFLGIGLQQAMKYAAINFLPEEVKRMVDQGPLSVQDGESIAKLTYGKKPENVIEIAEFISSLPRGPQRKTAIEIMEETGIPSSIAELEQRHRDRTRLVGKTIRIEIPGNIYDDFIKYGEDIGITDPAIIATHIVTNEIRKYSRERQ